MTSGGGSKSGSPSPRLMAFGGAASNILRMPDISTSRTRWETMGAPTALPFLRVVPTERDFAPNGADRHKSLLPGTLPGVRGADTTVIAVVGAQFGDEAKGKISDFLSSRVRYVVRSGGGPNAGHSIHLPEGSVVLHQLSVGVLRSETVGIS